MWIDSFWNILTGGSTLRQAWTQCENRVASIEKELAVLKTQNQQMNQKLSYLEARVDEWLGVKGHS